MELDAARRALERVRGSYGGRTLATVADNVDQAERVLGYATERSQAATAAIASGDKGQAVVAVRDAQHALAQVQQLTGSATGAERAFAEAAARAEAMRADIEGDVAAARAMRSGDPALAAAVTRADTVLRQGTDPRDPIAAVDALTKANSEIDAALAAARGAQEQQQRAQRALDDALRDARARISQARDFISMRRGAVGTTARTRLSEAERALDDAVDLATSDPARALGAARAAEQYAAAAMDAANDDMGGWPGQGGGGNGAQLGGLVTGIVLGGLLGGRGGSYGGGSFGGGGFSAAVAASAEAAVAAAVAVASPVAAASDTTDHDQHRAPRPARPARRRSTSSTTRDLPRKGKQWQSRRSSAGSPRSSGRT